MKKDDTRSFEYSDFSNWYTAPISYE